MGGFEGSRFAVRMAVALYYQSTLKSPPRKEWAGENGTISHICEVFNLPKTKRRVVKRVLENMIYCESNNIKYNGKIQQGPTGPDFTR